MSPWVGTVTVERLRTRLLLVRDDTDATRQLQPEPFQHITGQRLLWVRAPAAVGLCAARPLWGSL